MAIIRKIEIENFRSLKKLSWRPSAGINCLIGPGDSGKSSILDAIDFCIGARRNLQITDSDFYNLDVKKPIKIVLTLGNLKDDLKSMETYGLYTRGFDAKTGEIADEPGQGQETVLCLSMTVEADLEPQWTLISPRAEAQGVSRSIGWQDRQAIAPTRLGVFSENNLSWRRGSILNRISEEKADTSAALVEAARNTRNTFGEQAKTELTEALKIVKATADDLGIPVGAEVKALLDAHSVSISGGAISLHDADGVPLKNLGLGSARLLIAGLQKRASEKAAIILIDELEYGLEPHRVIRLIDALGAKQKNVVVQGFITTHSPTAVRELRGDQLFVVREAGDEHIAHSVGTDDDIQGTIRMFPEALLAPAVLVCEGPTEVGFVRGLDRHFAKSGAKAFTACGVVLVNGNGDETFKRARAFQKIGYRVGVLRDSDVDSKADEEAAFVKAGGTVFAWTSGRAIEDEIFMALPEQAAIDLLEAAVAFKEEVLVDDHIKSTSKNATSLEKLRMSFLTEEMTDATRQIIATASKTKNGWFKNITNMEDVAFELIGPNLENSEEDFVQKVDAIFAWIEDGAS